MPENTKAYYLLFVLSFILLLHVKAQEGLWQDSAQVSALNNQSEKLLNSIPDSALHLSELALFEAEKISFDTGMGMALLNLGRYYNGQADYEQAGRYFERAKVTYELLQDTAQLAIVYSELGNFFRTQQFYVQANNVYQQAVQFAEATNNRSLQAEVLKNLGGLYYLQGKLGPALAALHKSLKLTTAKDSPALLAAILNNLGVVYKKDGQLKEARNYLMRALRYLKENNNKTGLCITLMNLGEIHQLNRQYDTAEQHFQHGLFLASELGLLQQQMEAHGYLAALYAELTEYERAYEHQAQVSLLAEKVNLAKVEGKLSALGKKIESERKERAFNQALKEKELAILNQELRIGRLEVEKKNHLIYLVLALLAIAALGAFIFFMRQKQVKRENHRLSLAQQAKDKQNISLQKSEQKLRSMVETKDKFFGILAHDIRSPLYTLLGMVQLMKRDVRTFTQDELMKLTAQIERSLHGLTGMLDNLFQWANSETGIITYSPEELNVTEIIGEQVELLSVVAQAKGIYLMDEVADSAITLPADGHMLRVVFRNLLANALKFTERSGVVRIYHTLNETSCSFHVEDNGIGMSPEEIQQLFKKEKLKLSRRGTENEKGSGLGLVVCQEFVQQHGGKLKVSSEEQRGTTFTVILPLRQATAEVKAGEGLLSVH